MIEHSLSEHRQLLHQVQTAARCLVMTCGTAIISTLQAISMW